MSSQGSLAASLSGFGLMADIYDFAIVNLVRSMLEAEFGTMSPSQDAMLTGSALIGAIIGQLGFGATADFLGRRCLFIATMTLVGVAALGSAYAQPWESMGLSIYSVLAAWRFIMGLGIGGEYPLAAACTSESSNATTSATSLAIAMSGMCLGDLLAPGMVMFLAGPLRMPHPLVWRYAFGFGAVLALVVAMLRFLVLQESQAWVQASSFDAAGHDNLPLAPEKTHLLRFREKVSALIAMKWSILATSGVWFLYDVVSYGTSLHSTTIFPARAGVASASVILYINALALPGFAAAIFLASRAHIKRLQFYGFLGMTVSFGLMALLYNKDNRTGIAYLSIFALQRCMDAMGPGASTFIIPGQIYPTRIRATAFGISAATGKVGAVIGTIIFPNLYANGGVQAVMVFMAVVSALGAFWTQLCTPLYDVSVLEDIAALDSATGLTQQATMAESLLFASINNEAQSASLMPKRVTSAAKPDYGTSEISY